MVLDSGLWKVVGALVLAGTLPAWAQVLSPYHSTILLWVPFSKPLPTLQICPLCSTPWPAWALGVLRPDLQCSGSVLEGSVYLCLAQG